MRSILRRGCCDCGRRCAALEEEGGGGRFAHGSLIVPQLLATIGMKAELAAYRKSLRPTKQPVAVAYASDDETADREPLVDVEDVGSQAAEQGDESSEDVEEFDPQAERKQLLTPALSAALTKEGYQLIGSHSGVKLCRWTKSQLRGRGGCYKHTFYNITSYQCMEMTPSLACANKCVFWCGQSGILAASLLTHVFVQLAPPQGSPPARFPFPFFPDCCPTEPRCQGMALADGRA